MGEKYGFCSRNEEKSRVIRKIISFTGRNRRKNCLNCFDLPATYENCCFAGKNDAYATVGEALSLPPGHKPECLVEWNNVQRGTDSPILAGN